MSLFTPIRLRHEREEVPVSVYPRLAFTKYSNFILSGLSDFTVFCVNLQHTYVFDEDFFVFLQERFIGDDFSSFYSRVSRQGFADDEVLQTWIDEGFFEYDLLDLVVPYAVLSSRKMDSFSRETLHARSLLFLLSRFVSSQQYDEALLHVSKIAAAASHAYLSLYRLVPPQVPLSSSLQQRAQPEFWLHDHSALHLLSCLRKAKENLT